MWSEDLRQGDVLVRAKGQPGVRDKVCATLRGSGWRIVALDSDGTPLGRPTFFTHEVIVDMWQMPILDDPSPRTGDRAFLILTTRYDDGRVAQTPWVEGGPCDLDSFEGTTFQLLGMVDARAASLPVEELWVNQHDLVTGIYRFMGDTLEPSIPAKATNPNIDDTKERPRRGRARFRRR
jgi:hypothetical protein